jgi:hypothetical protein
MTHDSSSAVGRAAIDAYLDSVDLALIAAGAPRIDRLQVLQDLESQIADMVAREPSPITEAAVHAVLDKLEPPSHFAATFGQAGDSTPSRPHRSFRWTRPNWPILAAVSCALLPLGCIALLSAELLRFSSPVSGLSILSSLFLGVVFTPIALWMAYKQLQVQPDTTGRELLLKSTITYGVLAPLLVMLFAAAVTDGIVLIPFGFAAFVYLQYLLLRRLWRRISEAFPLQTAAVSSRGTNGSDANARVASASPMPAL